MKIDIFNHIFPKIYFDKLNDLLSSGGAVRGIHKRMRGVPSLVDLDERFRVMDRFGDYAQIICLSSPPAEVFPPHVALELARVGNDGMAELVSKHPDRFPGFIACVPMNDPVGMIQETRRAVDKLDAVGIQVFTNVNGRPLYSADTEPLFDLMAAYDLPIWVHPIRGPEFSDHAQEKKSRYEIWWALGWPYETSVAMAHMVFGGLFDKHPDIKVITHHMGGMIPYFEGRIGPGWDQLGSRTSDEDYAKIVDAMRQRGKRPVDYFRKFYADTALFGALDGTKCGLKFFGSEMVLFASDMPFDPEKGTAFIRWTIEIIDNLDISPFERYAIYEGNARRLCKLAGKA